MHVRTLCYRRSYILFAALLVCSGARAQQKIAVHLDPAQTEIRWTLGDVLHTVHGSFKLKGGLLTLDPVTGTAQGEILVDADSGDSGSKKRDDLMKKNQLETGKYPQVIFHPEKFSGNLPGSGTGDLAVSGMFNIHGVDHPLTLHCKVQVAGNKVTATTHFVVPYVEWGMKNPSTMMLRVSRQVDVDVTAHGYEEPAR